MNEFEIEDFIPLSETYKKIQKHRKNCSKWGREFCLDCFGGGINKAGKELLLEAENSKGKIEVEARKWQ